MQVNQQNLYKDVCEHGDAVLYWGCDLETTPVGLGRAAAQPHGLLPGRAGAALVLHIARPQLHGAPATRASGSPCCPTPTRPLQLAIAYTWITEGTYYKDYVDTHTIGFDWFEHYVLGNEDGIPKTPQWAEEKCGVPGYTIRAFARYWARHAVSIAHADGGGMIRSPFSREPARLEIVLLAMQGLGRHGTGQLHLIEFGQFGFAEWNPMPRSQKYFVCRAPTTAWMETIGRQNFVAQDAHAAGARRCRKARKLTWHGRVVRTAPRDDQFLPFEFPVDGAPAIRRGHVRLAQLDHVLERGIRHAGGRCAASAWKPS